MKNIFSIWREARQEGSNFGELIAPHIERLYRLGYWFTGTRHDAEGLVEELLSRLYPEAQALRTIKQPGPWLTKSLYHLFIEQSRHTSLLQQGFADDMYIDTAICVNGGLDISQARQQTYIRLEKTLFSLDFEQRSVTALHYMEGYSLPELAEMLGVPHATLKLRLHRARASLHECLVDFRN